MRKYVRLFAGFALGLYGLSLGNVALAAVSADFQVYKTGGTSPQTISLETTGDDAAVYCAAFSQAANGANNITSITYDGVYLTRIAERQQPNSGNFISLWYLFNPSIGTASVSLAFGSGTVWFACGSFHGVSPVATNYLSSDATSVATFEQELTISAGSRIVGNLSTKNVCGTVTPDASTDLLKDYVQGSMLWSDTAATSDGPRTIGGTCGSNDDWAGISVELKDASAATTTSSTIYSTTFENLMLDIGQTLVLGISLCTFGLFSWGAYRIACRSEQYVT